LISNKPTLKFIYSHHSTIFFKVCDL